MRRGPRALFSLNHLIGLCWLKLRAVANAGNGHAANCDRVIDDVREHRLFASRWEDARGENGVRGILRTRKREEVGEISREIADRPRTVNVIGHRQVPSSA